MRPLLVTLALLASLPIHADDHFAWQLKPSDATSATHTSPRQFEAAALSWNSNGEPGEIKLRASNDNTAWTDWQTATVNEDLTNRTSGEYFTSIVHFGANYSQLEYRIDGNVSAQPATVTFFAAPEKQRSRIASASEQFGKVTVRSRTEWGCPDGQGARWTPSFTTVTHEIVHHTAGSNTLTNWEGEVRNIWYFHTVTRGWGDVGYNFLIDPNGVVYEGRAGGLGAIGAHFSCRNSNTVGISLLGDFTTIAPTAAALASLDAVLEELARRHSLDPAATKVHAPTTLQLHTVSGHRDANGGSGSCSTTSCPGDVLYRMLPSIRAQVSTCEAISIMEEPSSRIASEGSQVVLTVSATGAAPLRYQWYRGISGDTSNPIEGANAASLTIAATASAVFWARISNDCSSADSPAATITLGTPPQRKRGRR